MAEHPLEHHDAARHYYESLVRFGARAAWRHATRLLTGYLPTWAV